MQTLSDTLTERGARYGDFATHATISQDLFRAISKAPSWDELRDVHREALMLIADKIARILNGDPEYADSWHDIAGYAKLVEDRCLPAPNRTPAPDENVAPVGNRMTEDQIKHMVDRFLGWHLPRPWRPDNGISYQRPNYAHAPADHDWPTGTNLFDSQQATEMVRYMLQGLPDWLSQE